MEVEQDQIGPGLDEHLYGSGRVRGRLNVGVARPFEHPSKQQQVRLLVVDGEDPELLQTFFWLHRCMVPGGAVPSVAIGRPGVPH